MPISYYIQVILALSVLAGILYLVLNFSKKLHGVRYTGEIEVLDRRAIDNGVALVLIKLRGNDFLLSVSNQRVDVIEKYDANNQSKN